MKRAAIFVVFCLLYTAIGSVSFASGTAQTRYAGYEAFTRGNSKIFTVYADVSGEDILSVHTTDGAAPCKLTVNGLPNESLTVVTLRKGINTLAFEDGLNIEYIELANAPGKAEYGFTAPYQTYEFEQQSTNGEILSDSRAYYEIASEASERSAVKLEDDGSYAEVVLTSPINAFVLRYCIPDSPGGGGIDAQLSLFINDQPAQPVALTSHHSWVYGAFPWRNEPSAGRGHMFFDDVRVALGDEYPAGTRLRFAKEPGSGAEYIILDLLDAELIELPASMPERALSITSFGAVPNDGSDDSAAIQECILQAASEGKEVWIPAGVFDVSDPVLVNGIWLRKSGTVIRGAGMWHTILTGPYAYFTFKASDITVRELSLVGQADLRRDTYPTAFTSDYNRYDIENINVHNVWVEHYNVGLWVNSIKSLHMTGCRFRNTYADGVNLRRGSTDCIVEQNDFRNNGDDGIAQWSAAANNENNIIRYNTVSSPWLANNIAVYGGKDLKIVNNLLRDTVTHGGGVNISTKFEPQPFAGTVLIAENRFERAGSKDNDHGLNYGAIWVNTVDQAHNNDSALVITDNIITDSSYSGICFTGSGSVSNVRMDGNTLANGTVAGIDVHAECEGVLTLSKSEINGFPHKTDIKSQSFKIVRETVPSMWIVVVGGLAAALAICLFVRSVRKNAIRNSRS